MRALFSGIALAVGIAANSAYAASCDGFTDVDSGDTTYCSAVTYLKDKGITLGCTGTTYCPNDYVTRLQMALFLQRMGHGGSNNVVADWSNTINGGINNTAIAGFHGVAVVAGGQDNDASGYASVIGGGAENHSSNNYSVVGGGLANTASGFYATVPGGYSNNAQGFLSVVMGYNGVATSAATGSFVFSDGTDRTDSAQFGAGAPNIFVVGASGGIYLFTNKDYSTYCKIGVGGGTWSCSSSKDVKRDFKDVDRQQVLDRVLALPVQTWRYKNEAPEIRHMGTFAQDFRAAFGLGFDDKTISMADADGVALAAIQGINAKVEARDAIIGELSHELAEIKAQLAAMAAH